MVLNFPDNNFTMLLAALLRSPSSQSVVLSIMKYDISERVISRLAKASRERSGLIDFIERNSFKYKSLSSESHSFSLTNSH